MNFSVIDKAACTVNGLRFLPVNVKYLLCAFILFWFFDMVKPFYIRTKEELTLGKRK
ncbi:hypothetical protein [uncultured Mucilaginibacter sp.]|uniref:hypothetical protein n=1 Tax=uncultured Mucilaginibacter sp. TaxID=797541 RepID=UPI0025D7F869|nr:hypothetical protein [uncultured Mucilaginibacter sp.]